MLHFKSIKKSSPPLKPEKRAVRFFIRIYPQYWVSSIRGHIIPTAPFSHSCILFSRNFSAPLLFILTDKIKDPKPLISKEVWDFSVVPVAGVEPARCCHQRILSYLLHTEHRRTQPPVEVVDGHQKALPILLFLKLMCKKLRFVCHFRSFRFGRKFWILEGHRRDVTHKRSTTAHAIDSSIANTL